MIMTRIVASLCLAERSVYEPCTWIRCCSTRWSKISRRTSGDRSWTASRRELPLWLPCNCTSIQTVHSSQFKYVVTVVYTITHTMHTYLVLFNRCNPSFWESKTRVLHQARHWHIIGLGHFGDKSFQAIICTGTDNSQQTRENAPKT